MRGMITRLALLGCICVVVSGAQYSCSSDGSGYYSTDDEGVFDSRLTLRDSTGVETSSFVMGESIRFDFEIRNLTNRRQTLRFGSAHTHDFVVLASPSNTVRWRWSEGQAFAQVATEVTFEPRAARTYSIVWNAALRDGTQLPVGSYRARAAMLFDGFPLDPLIPHELGSDIEPFNVR